MQIILYAVSFTCSVTFCVFFGRLCALVGNGENYF